MKKSTKKKIIKNTKTYLPYAILIIVLLFIIISNTIYTNNNHNFKISENLKTLLNSYEGHDSLDFKTDSDNDTCLQSYDVGDGVITFGYGVTFKNETEGIKRINELNNTSYKNNDCVKAKHLDRLQDEAITAREKRIKDMDYKYKANTLQREFDAIFLMYYLNESAIEDDKYWTMISDDNLSKQQYIDYFVNEFSTFKNYETYKNGWILRIKDSADVFFDTEYNRDY